MAIFEEVRLTWGGQQFVLPQDKVLRAIATVEDTLTLGQLHRYMEGGSIPLGKLATAYGTVLRMAGAHVTDEQVYAGMFVGDGMRERALEAVHALQILMIPPETLRAAPGKPTAASAQPAGSSPSATGSSSDKAG